MAKELQEHYKQKQKAANPIKNSMCCTFRDLRQLTHGNLMTWLSRIVHAFDPPNRTPLQGVQHYSCDPIYCIMSRGPG